jgi:hypothetical protein
MREEVMKTLAPQRPKAGSKSGQFIRPSPKFAEQPTGQFDPKTRGASS